MSNTFEPNIVLTIDTDGLDKHHIDRLEDLIDHFDVAERSDKKLELSTWLDEASQTELIRELGKELQGGNLYRLSYTTWAERKTFPLPLFGHLANHVEDDDSLPRAQYGEIGEGGQIKVKPAQIKLTQELLEALDKTVILLDEIPGTGAKTISFEWPIHFACTAFSTSLVVSRAQEDSDDMVTVNGRLYYGEQDGDYLNGRLAGEPDGTPVRLEDLRQTILAVFA